MSKYSPELLKLTADVWEPRLGYRPSEGEAEEMIRNVAGLFRLLMEWEFERERESQSKDSCSSDDIVDHCSLSNGYSALRKIVENSQNIFFSCMIS